MAERIKNADLERLSNRLCQSTGRDFFIQHAYGQPRLLEKIGPGTRNVSPRLNKTNLHRWILAYLDGFYLAHEKKPKAEGQRRFDYAIDWIEHHISEASWDEAKIIACLLARSMDNDQIQGLFESEMDADGFFNAEVEDDL